MELGEAKRLKQLEDENRQLKHVVGRANPGQSSAEGGAGDAGGNRAEPATRVWPHGTGSWDLPVSKLKGGGPGEF